MRIMLIDPPGNNKGLNVGLGYLAAALKRESHDVRVLDLNNRQAGRCGDPNPLLPEGKVRQHLRNVLDSYEPDIVGLSVKTFTSIISGQIASMVKEMRPRVKVVAGGVHITLDGVRYLTEHKTIDAGFVGEAEVSFYEALKSWPDPSSSGLPGIILRRGDQVIAPAGQRPYIQDLDTLPFPDYTSFSSVQSWGMHVEEYPLLSSRGCPFHCSFCSMHNIM